ncbi:hypothetical protein Tco_0256632 [Tanacetum coccineum]
MVRGKLRQLPSGEYRDGLQIANMDKMIVPLSVHVPMIPSELEGSTQGQSTKHPSDTQVFHNDDGNPTRANIKQALRFCNSDACYHDPEKCKHASPKVTTSWKQYFTTRMIKRFTVADDLKECSRITIKDKSKELCSKITTCRTKIALEESKTTS